MTKPAKATKAAAKGATKDVAAADSSSSLKKKAGAWETSKFRGSDLHWPEKDGVVAAGSARIPGNKAAPRP